MQKIYWFVSVERHLNWHNDISQWVQSQRTLRLMCRLAVWIFPAPLYVWHQLSQHIAQDLSSRITFWTRNWKGRPIWWCQLSRLYWARATASYPSFSLEQLKCEISDFTLSSKTFFGIRLTFDEQCFPEADYKRGPISSVLENSLTSFEKWLTASVREGD